MLLYTCIPTFVLLLSTNTFIIVNGCKQYEKCVFDELFVTRGYNRDVRPVINPNDTVIVQVQLVALGLQNIYEVEGTMVTVSFFRTQWTDPVLTWDPDKYGGVDEIILPADKVWLPDIALSNSASSFYEITYTRDFHVSVNYNGTVYWAFGGTLSTNCDIKLQDYPFDKQSCPVEIESWLYKVDAVDLVFFPNGGIDVSRIGSNTLWVLTGTKAENILKYNNEFSSMIFTLELTRKPLYYYINIISPTILLMAVALGVFWLPSECGEKISLAITVLLAFSVFQIVIMGNTPVNSDVVPMITQFVLVVMVMSTVSLLTSMAVSYISEKDPGIRSPLWLRKICLKYMATLMCMSISKTGDFIEKNKSKHTSKGTDNLAYAHQQESKAWSSGSGKMIDTEDGAQLTMYKRDNNNDAVYENNLQRKKQHSQESTSPDLSDTNFNTVYGGQFDDIKQILANLTKMREHIEKKGESNHIQQEWKRIGKVVDRAMFWLTLMTMVILIVYIFVENLTKKI